jgi:hypothetical protein
MDHEFQKPPAKQARVWVRLENTHPPRFDNENHQPFNEIERES